MTNESHQAITTMRAAFEFIEDLRDRIATLTAERDAAERALRECREEARDAINGSNEEETVCFGNLVHIRRICDSALTKWRRTKEGA